MEKPQIIISEDRYNELLQKEKSFDGKKAIAKIEISRHYMGHQLFNMLIFEESETTSILLGKVSELTSSYNSMLARNHQLNNEVLSLTKKKSFWT